MSLEVLIDWQGANHLVGRLHAAERGASVSFEYAPEWVQREDSFAIDPTSLPLQRGVQHGKALFGAIQDCGPDRWGRILIERAVRKKVLTQMSCRTDTQQIDGHFNFQGFDYLVEAKWRSDQPTEQELGGFQRKVNSQLESTRGFFVSVQGFRTEVAAQFNGHGANLILMDGRDLIHILDGRSDLRDALKRKIERAAQEGIVFTPLYE